MLVKLRRRYGQFLTSAGQLLLPIIGFQSESPYVLFVCVALMVPLSLFAWMSSFRRFRAIADMPTSRIATAAQGYVELIGRGLPINGLPLLSPLNQLPCLWYRYIIEHRDSRNRWVTEDSGESNASFIIDDGSGQCLVDPEDAELLISKKERWTRANRRYTQWLLIERQSIYVIGEFRTHGSVDLELKHNEDVKHLLGEWKRDFKGLLQRFDRDGNGVLDLEEWQRARAQAKREVAAMHHELRAAAEFHAMQPPADGRLYLISDLMPEKIAGKYARWAWFHLLVFFAALAALPQLWPW